VHILPDGLRPSKTSPSRGRTTAAVGQKQLSLWALTSSGGTQLEAHLQVKYFDWALEQYEHPSSIN